MTALAGTPTTACMPNLASVLNEQIRRLAKREVTAQTRVTRRLTAQYRRDIAALKRQVAALHKAVAFLERQQRRRVAERPEPTTANGTAEGLRFRRDGLRSHRATLGLSAHDYARLVGAGELAVYNWERGAARPRPDMLARLAAVRGLGKREAVKRLELLGGVRGERRPRLRGEQTAREWVRALVRGRKGITTGAVNAAWRKAGRRGTADNTLNLLVKAGELKRLTNEGGRGSRFNVAA